MIASVTFVKLKTITRLLGENMNQCSSKKRNASQLQKHKIEDAILIQNPGKERVKNQENVRGKYELRRRNASQLQKHKIEDEFMDKRSKTELKEDSDCMSYEETSQSEVEILLNDPCQPISSSDASTVVDSGYRKEVLNVLMRPYDEKEYKRLWENIKKPRSKHGNSHLTYYKDVNRELKRHKYDKEKWLTIMRGFYFWLEHLTQPYAFQPWKDAECLRTKPGSSK